MKLKLALCTLLLSTSIGYAKTSGTIDHKNDDNWFSTVAKIEELSIAQYGHLATTHFCYVEDHKDYCATAIWYTRKDKEIAFARVIQRSSDNSLFVRDVCRFREAMARRTCVNFDTSIVTDWRRDPGKVEYTKVDPEADDNYGAQQQLSNPSPTITMGTPGLGRMVPWSQMPSYGQGAFRSPTSSSPANGYSSQY